MKKLMIISMFVFALTSCQRGWYVVSDNDISDEAKMHAVRYTLPRASIDVSLTLEQHHYVPGPFSAYAESLLNISGVAHEESRFYSISNVDMKTISETDPEAIFWFVPGKLRPALVFGEHSQLVAVNRKVEFEKTKNNEYQNFMGEKLPNEIDFLDYGVKRNKFEVIDTVWRVIEKDSVIQRIPIYKSVEKEKNRHHKAQDAADFIIKIRKRRFKLEAAIDEQQASGKGIAIMIEKLEELEESYLSLFVGKTFTVKKNLNFKLVPETVNADQTFVLGYLDDEYGDVEESLPDTKELILHVKSGCDNVLLQPKPENANDAGVYVRNSGKSICSLELNDELIYSKELCVPQMYGLYYIPANLMNENTKLLIDSENGNLKCIE